MARSTRARPMPCPRYSQSVITSSIQALQYVGISKNTSVSTPAIVPFSSIAAKRCVVGDEMIRCRRSAVGIGAFSESCGVSRSKALITASLQCSISVILIFILLRFLVSLGSNRKDNTFFAPQLSEFAIWLKSPLRGGECSFYLIGDFGEEVELVACELFDLGNRAKVRLA